MPDDLAPEFYLAGDLHYQPYQQIVIAEKSGVIDLLEPVCKSMQATLATPTGEISDTMVYDLLMEANEDGRPLVVHQLGDFDPAGWQMAASTSRTIQALVDTQFPLLDVTVHAIGLTRAVSGMEVAQHSPQGRRETRRQVDEPHGLGADRVGCRYRPQAAQVRPDG